VVQARNFVTNGDGRAWQVLYDLRSWQVTQMDLLRPAGT
jgi:hypothetical protein